MAGLAGYVFLLGGIIIWVRLKQAGLPAGPGVAALPRNELLAMGLQVIGSWILLVAITVAAAFAVSRAAIDELPWLGAGGLFGIVAFTGLRGILLLDRWWATAVFGAIVLAGAGYGLVLASAEYVSWVSVFLALLAGVGIAEFGWQTVADRDGLTLAAFLGTIAALIAAAWRYGSHDEYMGQRLVRPRPESSGSEAEAPRACSLAAPC